MANAHDYGRVYRATEPLSELHRAVRIQLSAFFAFYEAREIASVETDPHAGSFL
jgi:hypothetical protein